MVGKTHEWGDRHRIERRHDTRRWSNNTLDEEGGVGSVVKGKIL